MRARVRSVEPRADDGGLEELVVQPVPELDDDPAASLADTEAGAEDGGASRATAAGPIATRHRGAIPVAVVDTHRIAAGDLGPDGDVVFDLLERARHLTPDECRKLEEESAWRWWVITPLPGSSVYGARATALVRGRAEGRADAIVALEAAVQSVVADLGGPSRAGSRVTACIANAGLAVLVRDLVEPETFETLFSPWRQVMHH